MKAGSESTLRNLSASGGFCGPLGLKSIKRSVINIQRSMLDVQSVHCSGQAESYTKIHMRVKITLNGERGTFEPIFINYQGGHIFGTIRTSNNRKKNHG